MKKQRIMVVGGGYGGLRIVEKLARNRSFEIVLVDKHPFHYFQTEAYRFVSGRINTCDVIYDLSTFCSKFENVTFVQDEVIEIAEGYVRGKKETYPFDILVLAVGTKDFIPEPFRPFAHGIKDIRSAYAFKRAFLAMLFERTTQHTPGRNIVIGGAGQSGVELAADLMSIINGCGNSTGCCEEITVTLVEGADEILPGTSVRLQKAARERLSVLGVRILTGEMIGAINEKTMFVGDEEITYDLFLFSGGIATHDFIQSASLSLDERGFVLVDNRLKVAENIFVIGDAASIKDAHGHRLPPTAQLAEQCAEYVAKVISKGETKPFQGRIYGMFTALGDQYGVGELFGKFYFKGRIAYWIKEVISQLYVWGIKTKVNSAYLKRHKI